MRTLARWALVTATLVLLAACSGIPPRERDRMALERYLDYAGPPVDHFSYFGRFSGWHPLGRYKLVVFTGVNDAYLLTLAPPCMDLDYTLRISFTSTASTVHRGFDYVRFGNERCLITEIRPIDYRAMKKDLREERKAQRESG